MPLFDLICDKCEAVKENVLIRVPGEEARESCTECDHEGMTKAISAPGGYHIRGNNGASQRPKNAGAFAGRRKT